MIWFFSQAICVRVCAWRYVAAVCQAIQGQSWNLFSLPLGIYKKKKGGGGDTVGFVHCWPMEKSWKFINDNVCQAGWSVFSSRDAFTCAVTPWPAAPAGAGTENKACSVSFPQGEGRSCCTGAQCCPACTVGSTEL